MANKPGGGGGGAAKHCPECGVECKPGVKYCDFCGTKLAVDDVVPAAGENQTSRRAAGMLMGLAVGCLAVGILVYVGSRLKEQRAAPAPPPSALDGKRQAAATCEAGIRDQARGPFRVIALRSVLVAEERSGYVVSGTVELQSAAGELQRKRYFCRVHPDARAGMVLDEGKMF
ncbi:MAG: hypothetical protein ACYC9Y_08670 [Candidatus Methylomirabilia bacterium]